MRIVRRPKFLVDIKDAYDWIAPDSEKAAEHLLDRIDATIARLGQYPLIGAFRQELAPELRSIRVRPFKHLIFYRVSGNRVVLVRLLHGAQALAKQDYEV